MRFCDCGGTFRQKNNFILSTRPMRGNWKEGRRRRKPDRGGRSSIIKSPKSFGDIHRTGERKKKYCTQIRPL